jgi:hypothetical protein
LQLEKPADGLSFTPSATSAGITFSPQILYFTSFTSSSLPLLVQVLASVTPGVYTLSFAKSESTATPAYLPIIPFQVTILPLPSGASADAQT